MYLRERNDKMNTFLKNKKTMIVKDIDGIDIKITIPKTPEPLKIIEFKRTTVELQNIISIILLLFIVIVIFFVVGLLFML